MSPRFLGRPGDGAVADKAVAEQLPCIFAHVEAAVANRRFLVGDRLTLADIAVASLFVNMEHGGVGIADRRLLTAYLGLILERPSFARWVEKERRTLAKAA